MKVADLKQKASSVYSNVTLHWNTPPKGRYMTFKEIVSYAGGGIGAYFIIYLGSQLMLSTTNMIIGNTIGVQPTDMYILYIIATLVNIPLTGIRANMIDNTRGKGGKYRPYLMTMGIPTALIAIAYVWFPYDSLSNIFTKDILGKSGGYFATCIVVLVLNFLLQFFYNFFNDAYTNLIHVLSPNSQERTDVLAIKSITYSLAPSIANLVIPLIAKFATNDNMFDIKVYRIAYPIFAIFGVILTTFVFANTKEKIVQAKTHTIQVSFADAFKAVAKNKYFWIISLAGWIGFLEGAYGNVLTWLYNYGHACDGVEYSIIQTLTGNASLWGMILAPFCIKAFGKKKVLLSVNFLNVVCIFMMLLDYKNIWWIFVCVYFNWMVGAFEQITGPAIQADIRDYQQYKTGERIDGMFATVALIGSIITMATSSILPAVYHKYGIFEGNGYKNPYDILKVENDPNLLYTLIIAIIIMAGIGAFLNMVPYFFYDFDEIKQKSVIRVLQVRALFEDYGNKALKDKQLVETIDMVSTAKEMAVATPKEISKSSYKGIKDKNERKKAKAIYKSDKTYNEEITISKFVCDELNKFSTELVKHQVEVYKEVFDEGLDGLTKNVMSDLKEQLKKAKALPKSNEDEKEFRKFEIEVAKKKITSRKSIDKYFGSLVDFVEPSMEELTKMFDREDELDIKLTELALEKTEASKADNKEEVNRLNVEIKKVKDALKEVRKLSKEKQDEFARFNRAAKPYIDARKLLVQQENYKHFDEIAEKYDEAKINVEEQDRIEEEEAARKKAEREKEIAELKAKKAAKKAAKK